MKRARKKLKTVNKKRRIFPKILLALLTLIVIAFVALGIGFFDESDLLTPIDPETGRINILVLGVDEGEMRTDTIMLASFKLDDASLDLISIPRDTKIYVKDRKQTRKINAIYGMSASDDAGRLGAAGTAEAVMSITGVPINYYICFSFDTLAKLFDILGPVTFDVPDVEGKGRGMNYDDPYQDLHIHLEPGVQELNGEQIVQFLRYRKSNKGTTDGSDVSRIARQQDFIKAVIDQKIDLRLVLKLSDIFSTLKSEVDTNITVSEVTKYATYIGNLSGEKLSAFSLPGESKTIGGASYYVCNLEETALLVSEHFEYSADSISTDVMLNGVVPIASGSSGNLSKPETKPVETPVPEEPEDIEEETEGQDTEETEAPTLAPTATPTATPTAKPTAKPTATPTATPTAKPTAKPTENVIVLD